MTPLKAIIIRTLSSGVDHVHILVDGPSPFPALDAAEPGRYPPYLKLETPRGYAEEWLRLMGLSHLPLEVVGGTIP